LAGRRYKGIKQATLINAASGSFRTPQDEHGPNAIALPPARLALAMRD
jgi:hypothetical protein